MNETRYFRSNKILRLPSFSSKNADLLANLFLSNRIILTTCSNEELSGW